MFGTVKKWDKRSSINGVEAQLVLDSAPEFKRDDVFLVYNETDTAVVCIESVETWKNILKMPNSTTEEVIETYKLHKEEQEKASQQVANENEQIKKEIADLWFEILTQGGTK